MSLGRSKRRFVQRTAPAALIVQLLSVLALPLALCCCLEMAGEAATHGSTHAQHLGSVPDGGPSADACPHHDGSAPVHEPEGSSDTGCIHIHRFVILLRGLIGVAEEARSVPHQPAVRPVTVFAALDVVDMFLPVESPPPRA